MISVINMFEGEKDWEPIEIKRNRFLKKLGNKDFVLGKALLKKGFDSQDPKRQLAHISGGKKLLQRDYNKAK